MAPVTIVVHPSQPVSNIAELVALAKRMPGKTLAELDKLDRYERRAFSRRRRALRDL